MRRASCRTSGEGTGPSPPSQPGRSSSKAFTARKASLIHGAGSLPGTTTSYHCRLKSGTGRHRSRSPVVLASCVIRSPFLQKAVHLSRGEVVEGPEDPLVADVEPFHE